MIRFRATGRPESLEASGLPPIAYSERPNVVYFATSAATTATMMKIRTGLRMPRKLPRRRPG